jgi:hypothetical protein
MKPARSSSQKPLVFYCRVILGLALLICAGPLASAQSASSTDRERGRTMLREVKEEIQKKYYDEKYHGMDLDARFGDSNTFITHLGLNLA